jgi:hypothetical protein
MNIGARNVKGGLILLPLGILAGLAMSLYAFVPMVTVPDGLRHYDDLPRRLLRLGHIAAIMLPLLNIAVGSWLDRLSLSLIWKRVASTLLLAGAIFLPLALVAQAAWPVTRELHIAGVPAIAFTMGTVIAGIGALKTPLWKFP